MDIQAAKELVIKAGKEVVASGLIARTWGNISCRVSDTQFVITPSGRPYEGLTPEEIVLVNIADLSYDGDVKPSSEKGIHAEAYKLRPEVNFVIHTHQMQASVISTLGFDINSVDAKSAEVIGDNVPLASYGLPGTGKLREGVVAAIKRSDSKAVIMAHHGALCMGESYEDAFAVAAELEKVCAAFICRKYGELTGTIASNLETVYDFVAHRFENKKFAAAPRFEACNSARDGSVFNISAVNGNGEVSRIDIKTGDLVAGDNYPASAELHRAIYKKRKDVNYIVHNQSPEVMAVSKTTKVMKPLLDDLAQLVGVTVKNAAFNPNSTLKSSKKVVRALKGRNGVLLANNGALCVAGSEYDATAVEMVMEKGCKAEVGKKLFGTGKPINPIETRLMRFVYLQKYSKQAKK
ncbi:MAG TPA: class II aldolase/adducin family protein [Candidatus Fimenecus excrementavium]|nr:class II aldolase/adducin family protein [Candidatus Fimenecus excrementavium]